MQIKINEKVLCIAPYISTTWSRVAAMHMKGGQLAIALKDGDTITIPGLPNQVIDTIFNCHALFLEQETVPTGRPDQLKQMIEQMSEPSIQVAFHSLDGMGLPMQHNPALANAPEIPPEILQKIGSISKILDSGETNLFPHAEPSCNCPYCQITRAMNPGASIPVYEEPIKDEELQFEQWAISKTGDQLFSVTNKLDTNEKYNVFLGTPVGCTCGTEGCEHILAVLKS